MEADRSKLEISLYNFNKIPEVEQSVKDRFTETALKAIAKELIISYLIGESTDWDCFEQIQDSDLTDEQKDYLKTVFNDDLDWINKYISEHPDVVEKDDASVAIKALAAENQELKGMVADISNEMKELKLGVDQVQKALDERSSEELGF